MHTYCFQCRAPGTEVLSYSMDFSSANTSVLMSPHVIPKEQDIVYGYTGELIHQFHNLSSTFSLPHRCHFESDLSSTWVCGGAGRGQPVISHERYPLLPILHLLNLQELYTE